MGVSANRVILIGNLGQDPKVGQTSSGTATCGFSLATKETWTDKSGQRQEQTTWLRVAVFGRLAEVCGQHLTKGRQVYVEGRIKTSVSERDGQRVHYTEIVASNVQFLGGPRAENRVESRDSDAFGASHYSQTEQDNIPFY